MTEQTHAITTIKYPFLLSRKQRAGVFFDRICAPETAVQHRLDMRTAQPYPGGEEGPPQLLKMANREFLLGAFLYCQFDVFGAAKELNTGMPHVKGGYEIVGKDGTVVTRVDPTLIRPTSLGRLSRLVGAPLNAAPGDYEFILSLSDEISGKTIEKREAFKIVAKEAPAEAPAEG